MNNCPICSFDKYKKIGKPKISRKASAFIRESYNIVQCFHCGIYYVNPAIDLSQDEWNSLYKDEYFSNQSNWLLKKRDEELSKRFEIFKSSLQTTSVNFLDVGCGEGKALVNALNVNWKATGIDITDNRISDARLPEINFIQTDLIDAGFPDDSFDCIYMDSVLEHVLNPLEYLNEIKRILKKYGIVYIGVPNEDCLFNDIKQFVFNLKRSDITSKIAPFNSPYHVVGFNRKSLQFAVNKTGLTILRMENIGRKFDFLSHKITSRGFWIRLVFLLPVEYIGAMLKRDLYYALYLKKIN